ncbi:MAG TPA: lysine exporter LysO family protein [Thermoplasmata archaeon]|nr:lysine exporter LysO family protein [Thermoplasmata archaeon]
MAFDPFLYVAFAIGLVAGRLISVRPAWIPRATLGTVVILVGLLGASLASVPWPTLLGTVPVAFAFAGAILGLTALFYLGLARWRPAPPALPPTAPTDRRFPLSLLLLAALLFGLLFGHEVSVPADAAIPWVLYALLAFVGFDIPIRLSALRGVWVPLVAASLGAIGAAALFVVVLGLAPPVAFATSLAFGFYSLAGPLVLARAGATLGLLAFLTNFLREDLTMLLSPVLGRRLRGEGLTALGGATSMDTTLHFVTRYGDPEAGTLALASGLVLTVAASLVLPALLALPL